VVRAAVTASYVPEMKDFAKAQVLNRDALVALLDKIGPSIILVHSQPGAFAWPVADGRPDLVKAIVGVEPNGPPVHSVELVGAPDWFREGPVELPYEVTAVPLIYAPAIKDASELSFVKEDKADAPDLVTCWKQAEPARQLPNLQKMPVMVMTSEASYHASYDHCTVKYLQQAGIKLT
jgi:pimeloyl-ACP methyl ester carboxylesterase